MHNQIEKISPENLSFDLKNPRISEFKLDANVPEQDVIDILWNVMGVEEIVLSIKASGFFTHEPLIAIKSDGKNIVIEGNRRLAAVKCILNPKLADSITGINKNTLQVSKEIKKELEVLPVIFVEDRKDAWKFIGFKHINGPAKWGSYAKAQYISEIKNVFGISLPEIASQIGDTNKIVSKLYQALQVIEQAENLNLFQRDDIQASRLYFSHLYTALGYEGYRDFLGIKNIPVDKQNPVPKTNYKELEELLLWLYGSERKEIQPKLNTQNPDLRYLEAVIKNREAIHALRDGRSLYEAYEISQPKNQTFEQSLLEAKRSLQKAQSYMTEGFNGEDEQLLKLAGSVAQIADDLYEAMEQKWKSLTDKGKKPKRLFGE